MRFPVAFVLLLAAAVPARAHFVFILPSEGRKAQVVFSDTLSPDDAKLLARVAHTKFTARIDGRDFTLESKKGKDCLELTASGKGPAWVVGVCPYGVTARGKEPFLLNYYAKAVVGMNPDAPPAAEFLEQRFADLKLNLVPVLSGKGAPSVRVLWEGKPLAGAEVVLYVPGKDEPVKKTSDKAGMVKLAPAEKAGLYGVRAFKLTKQKGKHDGKAYSSMRSYATLVFPASASTRTSSRSGSAETLAVAAEKKPAEDPGATKLLADARAERANWVDFPGFRADLTVHAEGKAYKGSVEVTSKGKVTLKLEGDEKAWARAMLSSIVGHRMDDAATLTTPCSFADDVTDHPLGRAIKVLNDEHHSSYRIRDKQVIEVNRRMKDSRFTITVLENRPNAEKKYLPASYVVNTWDNKSGRLTKSVAHHNTWTRVGKYDLPATALVVTSQDGKQVTRSIKLSGHVLGK
jgi:uncharacterized GH25 family protein